MKGDESFEDFQEVKKFKRKQVTTRPRTTRKHNIVNPIYSLGIGAVKHTATIKVTQVAASQDDKFCIELGEQSCSKATINDSLNIENDKHTPNDSEHNADRNLQKSKEPCSSILSSYICDICKLDITHFSVQMRTNHMNKCLDSQIESEELEKNIENVAELNVANNELIITECPLCMKNCPTLESRTAHIKKCSQTLGIDVQSVIFALQLQEKHALERMSLGLPLVTTKRSATSKTTVKSNKPVIKAPKNKADEALQLAKALSMSSKDEEDRQMELEDEEIGLLVHIKPTAVQLLPPQRRQKPGKRKQKTTKPIPVLLLRTDEEREKLIQNKVSALFETEVLDEMKKDTHEKQECGEIKTTNKELDCPLWCMSALAADRASYYVQDLLEYIPLCETEAGSNLQSLSQIHGYKICTQKPCDYTFNSSSQLKIDPPSTQEMLDVIVDEEKTSISHF